MGALILVASLAMPLATMFSPAVKRTRLLTAVLFCLAVCSCLCAINPAFGTVFGSPSFSLSLHPALLHPVFLAGAAYSATANDRPGGSPWQRIFAARSAWFGLVLGLPMATWLSTKFPPPGLVRCRCLFHGGHRRMDNAPPSPQKRDSSGSNPAGVPSPAYGCHMRLSGSDSSAVRRDVLRLQ
jgi:hypothetical protein